MQIMPDEKKRRGKREKRDKSFLLRAKNLRGWAEIWAKAEEQIQLGYFLSSMSRASRSKMASPMPSRLDRAVRRRSWSAV